MSQEFVPDEDSSDCPDSDSGAVSEQDILLVTLVGSPQGVRETILTLYRLGFAEVGDWSPVQRAANADQVMSVLIRRKVRSDSKQSGR
ncbi:MAG: hypothetical protein JGK24_28830 [Microcoleus sp. PH2017_29_MFU_D_A]|uniref:hypothetical protein n=1 Tax=unclassified Microcoleus TaxID=2642155 RepID=UPI001D6967A5|nr:MULTISPECIES: hypothetical protein [unclassified Microcoleus]TAE45842.1 MAG: hypothetical protein EAZ90_01015 [Oscillatoriales cyanobacterium]MCC3538311.1 hypothetical protein [Microcoleus sp. PH2017_25_DOB_D_A]MCC3550624.1 hypothetical protein [Microcoleus sp. PH2017_24_DOB_U_A]MCC3607121.1 hypothetical protein [Microcoleus sp. PH2017_29_MFU_D_A]MCC3636056.1 hypothetical protein [Microcoleus sp. PH2017_37_MFU_D_B]